LVSEDLLILRDLILRDQNTGDTNAMYTKLGQGPFLGATRMIDTIAAFDMLLQSADFVYLTRLVDGDGDILYRLSFRRQGESHNEVGHSLEELLDQLTDGRRFKVCSRCRQEKSSREFPRRPDKKDGRAAHCLVCDRRRKAKWYPRASRRQRVKAASPLVRGGAKASRN
jgi:hypothetical protein